MRCTKGPDYAPRQCHRHTQSLTRARATGKSLLKAGRVPREKTISKQVSQSTTSTPCPSVLTAHHHKLAINISLLKVQARPRFQGKVLSDIFFCNTPPWARHLSLTTMLGSALHTRTLQRRTCPQHVGTLLQLPLQVVLESVLHVRTPGSGAAYALETVFVNGLPTVSQPYLNDGSWKQHLKKSWKNIA